MKPIKATCDSDGSMNVGIKQGFHVYTEEENSKILGVIEYLRTENERLRGVEASNIVLTSINNRLRDLASDMHRWMGRAVYDGSVREYEYRDFGLVLRELGIDADDEDGYEAEDD